MSESDYKRADIIIKEHIDKEKQDWRGGEGTFFHTQCCQIFLTRKGFTFHKCGPCKHANKQECNGALEKAKTDFPDIRVI